MTWHCECCIDQVCPCQGMDILLDPDEGPVPWCRCCLTRDCTCDGDSVYQ